MTDTSATCEPWLQSFRGLAIDLTAPVPSDIDPTELAILLGRLHRFGGHTIHPYTVAEHSVRVSRLLEARGEGVTLQLAGLLHDAHEGYMGADIIRPLKVLLGTRTSLIEQTEALFDVAIAERFGLTIDALAHEAVHDADLTLLATEARDLMLPPPRPWGPLPSPLADPIVPFRHPAAAFAVRLSALCGEPVDPGVVTRATSGWRAEPPHGDETTPPTVRSYGGMAEAQDRTCPTAPPIRRG